MMSFISSKLTELRLEFNGDKIFYRSLSPNYTKYSGISWCDGLLITERIN